MILKIILLANNDTRRPILLIFLSTNAMQIYLYPFKNVKNLNSFWATL